MAPGGFTDGSRLQARFWDGGLNARSFVDWLDRELGAACRFQADAGGVQRCVPIAGALVSYRDAECQQPLVTVLDPSTAEGSVVSEFKMSCAASAQGVFRVGSAVTEDSVPTYRHSDTGACVRGGIEGGHSATALGVDALVSAEETRVTAADGAAGATLVLDANDGAREVRAVDVGQPFSSCLFDPLFDAETGPASLARASCVPIDAAEIESLSDTFADPSCAQQVFSLKTQTCQAPRFARVTSFLLCAGPNRIAQLGPSLASQRTFYSTSAPGNCQPESPPRDPAILFVTTAFFDAKSLPQLERHDLGDGRLRVPLASLPGGVVAKPREQLDPTTGISVPVFYDTQRAELCRPLHSPDGPRRCFPQALRQRSQALFADSICQTPVELTSTMASGCAEADTSTLAELDGTLSPVATPSAIYAVSGEPYSTLVFERLPGGCVAYTGQKSAEPLLVRTLVVVPFTDFAEVTPPF